ncbi:hypothetical protein GWK47_029171 [Chionoecetes opilio]|uniref:Uncharacterized protein n=1 Tax=Chionoecetes opilio TaxID=41210 RepID=A0A8J4YKL8_CHIOP|nr:hypothetical protein GWK47_029171 [Chionoecetes opilio]
MAVSDVNIIHPPLLLSIVKRLISQVYRFTWETSLGDALRAPTMCHYRPRTTLPAPMERQTSRILYVASARIRLGPHKLTQQLEGDDRRQAENNVGIFAGNSIVDKWNSETKSVCVSEDKSGQRQVTLVPLILVPDRGWPKPMQGQSSQPSTAAHSGPISQPPQGHQGNHHSPPTGDISGQFITALQQGHSGQSSQPSSRDIQGQSSQPSSRDIQGNPQSTLKGNISLSRHQPQAPEESGNTLKGSRELTSLHLQISFHNKDQQHTKH